MYNSRNPFDFTKFAEESSHHLYTSFQPLPPTNLNLIYCQLCKQCRYYWHFCSDHLKYFMSLNMMIIVQLRMSPVIFKHMKRQNVCHRLFIFITSFVTSLRHIPLKLIHNCFPFHRQIISAAVRNNSWSPCHLGTKCFDSFTIFPIKINGMNCARQN